MERVREAEKVTKKGKKKKIAKCNKKILDLNEKPLKSEEDPLESDKKTNNRLYRGVIVLIALILIKHSDFKLSC